MALCITIEKFGHRTKSTFSSLDVDTTILRKLLLKILNNNNDNTCTRSYGEILLPCTCINKQNNDKKRN